MRGGLDETLARMRRREEALRRRNAESTTTTDDQVGPPVDQFGRLAEQVRPAVDHVAPAVDQVGDAGLSPTDSRDGGPGWTTTPQEPAYETPPQRHVLEDAAEALRSVVAAHPGASVNARIDHDGQAYDLRVAWSGEEVTVTGQPATPPPSWPLSTNTVAGWPANHDGLEVDPAARLAELIRRNPSLLTGEEPAG